MRIHLKAVESEVKWKVQRVQDAQETLQTAYQNYLAYVNLQVIGIFDATQAQAVGLNVVCRSLDTLGSIHEQSS